MTLRSRLGVLCLFGGSGCAALIFEVTWLQLLQLVIGSSAVSLGVLLATYMGGMCVGALAAPRILSSSRHPLRVYAMLELATGACAVAELVVIPLVGRAYSAHVGYGIPGFLLRGSVSGICLLPPTMLMGAALPIAVRWFGTTRGQVAWAGWLYGANIAGAVVGCLWAGFYLLRVHDMVVATLVAAAIDAGIALAAFALSFSEPQALVPSPASELNRGGIAVRPDKTQARPAAVGSAWRVHAAIALSGFCALGAEVIWTRLLSLLLGGTVYTFSIVLAVLLFGLALGSVIQAPIAARIRRPQIVLGGYQILITAAIAWAAFVIARILPYWSIDPATSQDPLVLFELEVLRCLLAILPAACLWGASFPVALAAIQTHAGDPARPVAGLYSANTLGAIAGALTTSLWIIPALGTQRGAQLLIGLSALAGLTAMGSVGISAGRAPLKVRFATLGTACAVAVLAARSVAPVPAMIFAYGRYAASWMGHLRVLYAGEGTDSSVAVTESPSGSLSFHVSGKVEASNGLLDMRLQLMLGHLPALVHDDPRSILVVGMGTGVTAGAFVQHPDVTRIVIVELEPLVPTVASRYFGPYNNHVERDPRVQIIHDDARHYVQSTTETFDVITTDPVHPWVKGSAALYTREYFDLLARHLRPGGVVAQWVPLYETTADVVKTELATFFDSFPQSTIWDNGIGWDVVLLGQTGTPTIDVDRLEQRLNRANHISVLESLRQVQLGSATDLLATYAGRASDLRPWTAGAERNRDFNLRLQYLAGLGLNRDERQQIYDQILAFSRFPTSFFVASDEVRNKLNASLDAKERLRQSLAERRARAREDD